MASVSSQIPLPAPLRTSANLTLEWRRFKSQWLNYVKAAKVNKEEKDCQAAIFLACIGTDAYHIFTTMEFEAEDDKHDPEKLLDAFERHCIGEINEVYERYVLHRRHQEPGETFDTFVGDLRRLVKSCDYGTMEDSIVRDRIVLGIRDDATRKKLLQTRGLDLAKAIDICRSAEATTRQLKAMTSPDEVQSLRHQPRQHRSKSRTKRQQFRGHHDQTRSPSTGRRPEADRCCRFCGRKHGPSKRSCPAFGDKCTRCGKSNHWAAVCRSKQGNEACQQITESLLSLHHDDNRRVFSHLYVDGRKVKFLLDCGATVNLLPRALVASMGRTNLRPPKSTLRMFDRTELHSIGMITASLSHPRTKDTIDVEFYVTDHEEPILGIDACRRLDMLRVVEENICGVKDVRRSSPSPSRRSRTPPSSSSTPPPPPSYDTSLSSGRLSEADIFERYADLFDGKLGMMEGEVHLEVNPDIKPVQMPLRRLPVAIRDNIESELKRLVKDNVIVSVTEPTPWVSALLAVMRPSGQGVRICIDPSPLNRALMRSTHYIPSLDDILPRLADAKVFSTVDIKNAFWHLKLDKESSLLTTFQTPFGRYRWLRLAFGLSVAPEIWTSRIQAAVADLKGVYCIADDLICTGCGPDLATAARDHDANLIALLNRCRSKGLKLNKEKFRLNRAVVSFMGHELTTAGLRADPRKIKAIQDMPIPADRAALQRIIGFANFLARYCPMYSEITAPLRELLTAQNEYCWDIRHTEAFNRLKLTLASPPVLQYFAPNKAITIQADSSMAGIGAVLVQSGKVVEYASRALTKTEMNYAMIEKELLAIVFAFERFDSYVYGKHVTVETDHRPLQSIHRKSLGSAPKRLQRMFLRLQRYSYDLVWKPGSTMILPDTLSRAYPPTNTEGTLFDEELASLSTVDTDQAAEVRMVASAETIDRISSAAKDDEYVRLMKQTAVGWPESPAQLDADLRPYHTFADELSTSCGLVFKGHRLVVPRLARADILDRLHGAHTGVNAVLRRARETVFWPGITADIKRVTESCAICQTYQQSLQKEPLMSHPPPSRPWEKVGVDIFMFGDRDYLCTVDYLSGFFEIDRLPSKKVTDIVYCLRQHFARHGIPIELCSDNSPFNSREFRSFAQLYEFKFTTSSPRYPQSNGRVECAIKTAKRLMTKAREANTDPLLAILEWRNTPSEQLGPSPVQILMGRRTRSRLPTSNKLLDTPLSSAANRALANAKERQAIYYNRRAKQRPPLNVGQTVRVQFDDRPDWRKAEVTEVLPHRSYEVRFEDGTTRRRTSKHVRFSAEAPIIVGDDSDSEHLQRPRASSNATPPLTASRTKVSATSAQIATSCGGIPPHPLPRVTRSGRIIKRPARYLD